MVHVKQVCKGSSSTPCMCKVCKCSDERHAHCSHVPYSVAWIVRNLVDTVVYVCGGGRGALLPGWASREANVRPPNRSPDDCVVQLGWCFDQNQRVSPHHIQRHLGQHFGIYAGPPRCLRVPQVSGWITSEVDRRKKACLKIAINAVSAVLQQGGDSNVSATSIRGTKRPRPSADDGYEDGEITTITTLGEEVTSLGFLERQKSKWRAHRPKGSGAPTISTIEGELDSLKRKWRCHRLRERPNKQRAVSQVVNKRGRRGRHEYECRWVNSPADETTWEPAISLCEANTGAVAVALFEKKLTESKNKNQLASLLTCGFQNPIRTKCCNTIVELDTYNEGKEVCLEVQACRARRERGKSSRTKTAPSRFR